MEEIQGYAPEMSSLWTSKIATSSNVLQGLSGNTKTLVDATVRGAFMEKIIDKAHQLLEEMTANNY